MADFRIQRFKHTWKGAWSSGITYNPDDVVSVSGKVYNCLVRHVSNVSFYQDLDFQNTDIPPVAVPRWELIADGVSLKGDWQTDTEYFIGDIVKNGASSYICLENHFSSNNATQGFYDDFETENYWTVFIEAVEWSSNWQVSNFYKIGEVVRYNGIVYRCITAHTSTSVSASGIPGDIANWEILSIGNAWIDEWQSDFIYSERDIVRYGGIVYRCIAQHVSGSVTDGLEVNLSAWEIVFSGVEYVDQWQAGSKYRLNDVVKYGPYLYICILGHNTDVSDTFNNAFWNIYCPGQEFQNVWNENTLYRTGEIVRHGGYLFVSNSTNLNSIPDYDFGSVNSDWAILFVGTRIRGEWVSNLTYDTGDVVRRNGQLYVAKKNTPINQDTDIIDDNSSINSEYWDLLIPGTSWRAGWQLRRVYFIGDLVSWRGASYRCLIKHFSDDDSRPDVNQGSVWEQYTYGDPGNQLSFIGDLKYFGTREDGSTIGTTRLAIGNDAQTLESSGSIPEWKDFSSSNQVFFVSTNGVDRPDRGVTSNSSWRTVRYALERIQGPATLFVRTGTYEEVLPLRIPADVAVVGDELRSTKIIPIENLYSSSEISIFQDWVNYLTSIIDHIILQTDIPIILGQGFQIFQGSPATTTETGYVQTRLNLINTLMTDISLGDIISTNVETVSANRLAAIEQLNNNIEFIQDEFVGFLDLNYPQHGFNRDTTNFIVEKIISALTYDLRYTGNFKTVELGKYFYFASHSEENKKQNMFLLGNATGLRNLTLLGLTGELGELNTFLTQRPTAGAYASLDPGWGSSDSSVWISTRSPYVQNVTTFGTACIGLKVDGDLHSGGNKTIVANDFTQILSDGIGAWCNSDGASELVSVFTYYNHIGYLCTNGGRIRGTNGNCSYGKFGAVAESFDPSESPITALVDNRGTEATIDQIITQGGNIKKLFFDNSGQNYTTASFSVIGPGLNAELLDDEFRDQAVFESRVFAPGDSSVPGGSGYSLFINNAQLGSVNTISLSASTDEPAINLRGLRISIETGTGAGQYGFIADWNNSTKVALVGNEFYEPYEIVSTSSTGNILSTTDTSNLKLNDAVCFVGDIYGGVSANRIYYINSITSTELTVRETITPAAAVTKTFTQAAGSTTVLISFAGHPFANGDTINVAAGSESTTGWSRTAGTGTAVNTLHTVTLTGHGLVDQDTYKIEFQTGSFSAGTVISVVVTVVDPSTFTFTGPDTGGPTENINIRLGVRPTAGDYTVTVVDPDIISVTVSDSDYTFGDVAFSFGGDITLSDDTGSMDLIRLGWNHYQPGTTIAATLNTTTSYRIEPRVTFTAPDTSIDQNNLALSINWSDVTYGNNKFVAVAGYSGTARDAVVYSSNGSTWSSSTLPLARWSRVKYGGNKFVAVSIDGKSASSADGIIWTEHLIPNLEYTGLAYGDGVWIAVASGTNKAAKSLNGEVWSEIDLGEGADWADITYGKGIFVAVAQGDSSSADRAYSVNQGSSWTTGTFGGGAKSIAYGNDRFVVIAGGYSGANNSYISFDGVTWSSGAIPEANWQRITYGQGKFVAVATASDFAVESVDGVDWFNISLGGFKNHTSIVFGNPSGSPKFITVALNDDISLEIVRGTRTQGRLRLSTNRATGISLWEQGSGYSSPPSVTVFDPNNTSDAIFENRIANGVIGNPSIVNPGIGWVTASTSATISGDGFADRYQLGNTLLVRNATRIPGPGSNLLITGINDYVYRVLAASVVNGTVGNFTLRLTITKILQLDESPDHLTTVTIRERYSQVRLTGHDFLDIGLGNFEQTNYPDTLFPVGTVLSPENETRENDGGRVFYTSTDQDGNFRVGELFAVEQSTGTVTISAEFFQLEGLEEISIGGVSVGGTGVVIREFSTDPLFIADSNNVVPTQKAIKEFITRRISGGGSDAFTGQFTAGVVRVGPNTITTVTGQEIIIPVKVAFNAPISGTMLVHSMFLAGTGFVEEE